MPMIPLCSRATVPLAVLTFLFIGTVTAQDTSDRPPWAQKSKSASKSNPASSPTGEPGKIVQPTPPSAPAADSQDPAAQRGRIRVTVNLVNVLVSVLDEHNRPAPDLPLESFQLFEEGVQQKIDKFESETLQPLDLAIMIDASLSAHKEITFEQEAAAHFIRQVLRPGDRLSVFLGDVFVEAEDGEAVAGTQHLANEVGSGFLFESDFLVGAEAGVNHDGEVERLKRFGFELIDFLLDAFFEELEGFEGKIGRGTIVLVEDANEHVDEVDGDADAAALGGGILRIAGG